VIADHAIKTLSAFPGKVRIWAVGERVHARLADSGLQPKGLFQVPNSMNAIAPLVGQIQIQSVAQRIEDHSTSVYVFHNRPKPGSLYDPVDQRLLPFDTQWQQSLVMLPWPSKKLPDVLGSGLVTLQSLIHEYLFIALFRACAESLASENASRLAAMPPCSEPTRTLTNCWKLYTPPSIVSDRAVSTRNCSMLSQGLKPSPFK